MVSSRRSMLKGTVVGSLAVAGCLQYIPCLDDIACFNFRHYAADDVSDRLEITHTGGEDLPANEVYITNVVTNYQAEITETVAWSELDDKPDPSVGISGEKIRVGILFPDVVQVLWYQDGEEQVIGETRSFR